MPRNADVNCEPNGWTLITNSDVSSLRAQNKALSSVFLQATVGTVEPAGRGGSVELGVGQLLAGDMSLEDLFPGVLGANRVWCFNPSSNGCLLSVSHA